MRYTSEYCARIATGAWKAKKHKKVAAEARTAWKELRKSNGGQVWMQHDKSHKAKSLAERGKTGDRIEGGALVVDLDESNVTTDATDVPAMPGQPVPLTGHRHPTRKGGSLLMCVRGWVFFERSRIVVDPRRGSSLAARCSRGYGTSVVYKYRPFRNCSHHTTCPLSTLALSIFSNNLAPAVSSAPSLSTSSCAASSLPSSNKACALRK